MPVFLPFIGAVLPLLITPGLFFHYESTPKLLALAIAVALALPQTNFGALRASAHGRWLIVLSGASVAWFAIATAASSRPMMSLAGSQWREFGLAGFIILVLAILVAAAQLAEHPERRTVLLRSIAVSGLVLSIYGIAQYFDLDPLQAPAAYRAFAGNDAIVRPPGSFGHADYFAWWLAVEFFCSLELGGALGSAAAAASAIAIVLTGTRAGILALAVGLIVTGYRFRPRRRQWLAGAVVLAALLAFAFTPAGVRLRHRLTWTLDERTGGARPLLWRDSVKMALAHPLLGFGPETFPAEFGRYESDSLAKRYPDFHHESPHNLALDALTAAGLPALLLLAGWAWLGWRSAAFVASGVASMFSAGMLGPLLITGLVLALEIPGTERLRPASGLQPAKVLIAVPLAVFALVLGLSDFRLARFQRHPEASLYPRLTVAAEDIYCSRMLAKGALKTATAAAARATSTADDPANAWYNLAVFSAAQNDLTGTRRALEQAVTVAPKWFKPHQALGRLLAQTGDSAHAQVEVHLAEALSR